MKRICKREGCGKPHVAKGYCAGCYNRWKRTGSDRPSPPRVRGVCSLSGCDRPHKARGFCDVHYQRLSRGAPLDIPIGEIPPTRHKWTGDEVCAIDGCDQPREAREWCKTHYSRWYTKGDPNYTRPPRLERLIGRDGYAYVYAPDHPVAMPNGKGFAAEHRVVMSDLLNRPLRPGETVHHKNGIRSDNRPENLELWASPQPSGQRVVDLVAFARLVLDLYEVEVNDNPDIFDRSGQGETHPLRGGVEARKPA